LKKILFISLAVILALSIGLIGCEGEGEGEGEGELPSEYIGSGALDGDGIPLDFFSDLDVRKGFCYAFDYDTYIAEALSGQGAQRGSPVVDGLPYYNPAASMYDFDLAQAETHLKAAWSGAVWENGFKFTLLYNAGNLPRKTACEILSENLLSINESFQVSILPIAWPTFLGKIWGTRDMPMFQIGWLPDYPHPDNFIVPFMHSTGGAFSAFQGYGSAALDTQIEEAFMDTNPVTQETKYHDLQEAYYTDPGGIMLAQPLARRYFTNHINGFVYNPCESAYTGRLINMSKSNNGGGIPYLNPGTFTFDTIGEIDSLDPAWIYDTASGMQVGLIYEQLLYYNGNATDDFLPLLATDIGTYNATDKTLRFTIKAGVKFHDGNNLTAEDVEYTFERAMVQDRSGGPVWMFFQPLFGPDVWHFSDTTFAAIDAAVEDDGNDVVFTLYGDYWLDAFRQILCGQWACIVDKESTVLKTGAWDGTGANAQAYHDSITSASDSELFDDPNGTGPWKLTSWAAGDQIILEDFGDYHGGSVPFDNVITRVRNEWTARKLSLLAGDVDLVYVPATNFDEMDEETGLLVYEDLPSLSIDAFFFNMLIGGPSE
jgi:ABC-type transport system substrate-binding protein